MDFSETVPGILLGFLFTLVQLGFVPAVAAYFIAKSRLQNSGKRLRGWKPALASVLVLILGMFLDTGWDGNGISILSFIAAGALFGIAVGFTLAWLDNRPIDPFK